MDLADVGNDTLIFTCLIDAQRDGDVITWSRSLLGVIRKLPSSQLNPITKSHYTNTIDGGRLFS